MGADGFAEDADVAVLDVAAVFPQVDGDAVGSGEFGEGGGVDGVGLDGAAGLADGGDVVDVDAEGEGWGGGGKLGHAGGWSFDWFSMIRRLLGFRYVGRSIHWPIWVSMSGVSMSGVSVSRGA